MIRRKVHVLVLGVIFAAGTVGAQPADDVATGRALWDLKRTRSAIETLTAATASSDTSKAAEASYWLGRIYLFKGWESEGAFPGWHDEPEYREQAVAAFRAAVAARPRWSWPHIGLGQAALRADQPAQALTAFDAALERDRGSPAARVGRWRALKALERTEEIKAEVAAAVAGGGPGQLAAALEGYELLGQHAEAEAIAIRLVRELPSSEGAEAALAARIEAARRAKNTAAVIEQARAFPTKFPSSTRLPAVYDALIDAYQADATVPPDAIVATVAARLRARPDPAPHLAGAWLLVARGAMLDKAIQLAEASIPAAETFIKENLGAYKMEGKVLGSLGRARASALDLIGWVHFLRKDLEAAASKLEEAERLSRGLDFANQFHLGELARAKGELEKARERYLSALTLSQGPPPLREAARKGLADVQARLGNDPAGFDAYFRAELDRRRDARREALVRTMVDRPAPVVKLTDVSGRDVDLEALRGKVVLLNFFSSW